MLAECLRRWAGALDGEDEIVGSTVIAEVVIALGMQLGLKKYGKEFQK